MKEWFSSITRLFNFQQTEEGLFSKKNIITMLVIGIAVLIIPAAYRLLQEAQIFQSRAAGEVVTFVGDNISKDSAGNITTTTSTVGIELRSPLGPPATVTPTPTTGTKAPSISSVVIENNRDNCIVGNQGSDSNKIKISWTNGASPVTKVLISTSSTFDSKVGWYRKLVTTTPNAAANTTGPAGFVGVNGAVNDQNLIVKPDDTIYIRLGIGKNDDNLGPIHKFTAQRCSPTGSPTPTPTSTLTPTPTGGAKAPNISSVIINNANRCISSNIGANSNLIKISWTNGATPAKLVQISTIKPFSITMGWYSKSVTPTANTAASVTGPAGFVGANGAVKNENLTITPGNTVYIRLGSGDGNPGPVFTFTATKCT